MKRLPVVAARAAAPESEPPESGLSESGPSDRHQRVGAATRRKPQWMRELARAIDRKSQLEAVLDLSSAERQGAQRAEAEGLPLRITPHYFSLIDQTDPKCPIRLQCVPLAAEAESAEGDLEDPLGEEAHTVAPHLVSRYPDRALLLATDRCAVYCRFCTRSRMVGDGGGVVPDAALEPAMRWLEGNPQVRDVIVSGGDPLAVATSRLVRLIERLRRIPSVETIRLATRVPVTLPSRITRELVSALKPFHPLWIMTHFNHPRELAPAAQKALARLANAGFPIMNQTVLLRGVNDDAATLTELFRGLVRARVKPYYLLQMDPVRGTSHLRTPLARGIELMEALQGRLSGIAIPKLIVDTPNGMGKVPIGPDYVVDRQPGRTRFRTPRGVQVEYIDPKL